MPQIASKSGKTAAPATKDARKNAPRPPRTAYHHGDLPRALVKAALDLISKEGADGFTLREAARVVGVTHGAAYRHFADKTALLAALAEEGFRELVAAMEAARRSTSQGAAHVRARLHAIGTAYVRFALDHPSHFRVMYGPRLDQDGRFPALEAEVARSFNVLLDELVPAAKGGLLSAGKGVDHALALWTMAHGYSLLVLARRIQVKPAVAERYFGELFATLLDGMIKTTKKR